MAKLVLEERPRELDGVFADKNYKMYGEIYVYDPFQRKRIVYRGLVDMSFQCGERADGPATFCPETNFVEDPRENLISLDSADYELFDNISKDYDEFLNAARTSEEGTNGLIEIEDQTKRYISLTTKTSQKSREDDCTMTYHNSVIENSLHIKEDLGIHQVFDPVDDIDDMFITPDNNELGTKDMNYTPILPNSDGKCDNFSYSNEKPQLYDMNEGEFNNIIAKNPVLTQSISEDVTSFMNTDHDKKDVNNSSSYSDDLYGGGIYTSNDDYSNSSTKYAEKRGSRKQKEDTECTLCLRKCKSANALNHHMLVHSEARPYTCEICKKAFKEQPTLRRHMWTHMAKQHQCDICKKFFVEKSSLRRHMSTIHADFKPGLKSNHLNSNTCTCKICGKLFKSFIKLKMHAEMHGNPNYECRTCGKVYAGRSHLKIHQRIHTGEKPFTCDICHAKFAFKHVLKSHQARIHQSVNNLTCNICYSSFEKKSHLAEHVSSHFLNMKKVKHPYNTQKSSESYNNRDSVKNETSGTSAFGQLVGFASHNSISLTNQSQFDNSVEESYLELCKSLINHENKEKKCQMCCKEFERIGDLKRHIISHMVQIMTSRSQNPESKHKFDCGICTLYYNDVDKFKAHLREHANMTLYKCNLCNKGFSDSSNYSKHKKIHGDRCLQCDACKRKYKTKCRLIAHIDYHKCNKPKNCGFCGKEFYFESNLKKHIKISHVNKSNNSYKCELCTEKFNSVKQKWEHQWILHDKRKVETDSDTRLN